MSRTQQFTLFVEQNGRQVPNQEQFIKQFENILAKSSYLNSGGQHRLLIKLYPEHLGSLRIELLQSEGGLIAKIMASTNHAKELVESHLSSLKHSFQMQNIAVDKIDISTQLMHQSERSLQRESEQQKQQSQQQNNQNEQHDSNEENSFVDALLDELVNIKV
nr:flagellar hook-length control protein FliK [Fredinandcohnia sp. SECRCQ15]